MSDISKIIGVDIATIAKINKIDIGDIGSVGGVPIPVGGIDTYTKLMLHMDGSDDGTTFTDSSGSGHTVTRENAVTKTGVKKFGTASGYFDGTSLLTIPDSANWDYGAGDFTIDFWANLDLSQDHGIFTQFVDNGNRVGMQIASNGFIELYVVEGTVNTIGVSAPAGSFITNTWQHVALVRYGNIWSIYVDGTDVLDTGSPDTSAMPTLAADLLIGNYKYLAATKFALGYIDEFRISKGIARWTANFTPPTGGIDTYTKLMLHMDGADDGVVFTDDSASAHAITRNGGVTKTGTKKFGTASGFFDGAGDDLQAAINADFDFGSGDFTLDAWFSQTTGGYLAAYTNGDLDAGADWYWTTASFGCFDASATKYTLGGWSQTAGTWYHNAIVRYGNTITAYQNGVAQDAVDVTGIAIRSLGSEILTIASRHNQAAGAPVVYIDELRISKGIARWTANFTPPVAPYS